VVTPPPEPLMVDPFQTFRTIQLTGRILINNSF
jgi:hypothetical protein